MANNNTIKAGVIGWPVSHSLSPRLHGFWLKKYGIDGTYDPIAVEPEKLESRLKSLSEQGFAGTNVTVPHKEAALRAVDEIDDHARRIGAVNTIVVLTDGRLRGSNTDGFGFLENLKAGAPEWRAEEGPAIILGAGGASRAVAAALVDAGVPEISLVNRTESRATEVAQEIGGPIKIIPWNQREDVLEDATVVVNTTILGMVGKPPLELSLKLLPKAALVTDIVYAPLETTLLKDARAQGNPTVDGLGMLLHQARPGFAAWFGQEPEVTLELRSHVLAGMAG
ncbi:MAG: shikimate dehydrogenase [Rhodospirillaceae bacterium]|jgi:shikimate dehydrogenase|nr:shikimate dehydrogenase [Rhodospirillales bacterium]MBT3904692.1 shikimate dehydrogenase [Rhodospirillaceae bacterium]MBT4701398.1 shikimate dehydrogenase [Rhodospirillaceae bacterium]MBT5036226.1 shikimate dehydrogenase [Rhodospirillaceae bacterium]MBT6221640.1 shikimate dehydrogenase [Rhodospirillaceae bacterium]